MCALNIEPVQIIDARVSCYFCLLADARPSGQPAAVLRSKLLVAKSNQKHLLQQAGPGYAGTPLRYSHPAALMSRCAPTFALPGGLLRCSAA